MSSIKKTARIAGFLYLLLGALAFFGMPSYFARPADIATTANHMMASGSPFRFSILSALLAGIINIFAVLALYRLLKPVNKNMAWLMVIFILVGIPIGMLNELNRLAALLLSKGAGSLTVFTADQLRALVPLFLDLHRYGITIAGFFWGLWLFPMGYLVFKSGYIPRILGLLLMMGCFAYLTNSLAIFIFPDYKVNLVILTGWGEVLLPLWLLIKGVNVERWEKRALESVS